MQEAINGSSLALHCSLCHVHYIYNAGLLDFGGDEYLTVTLSRDAGSISCVNIPIIDDTIFESVEDFRIELSVDGDQPGIQLGDVTIATVLIDDLGTPIISMVYYSESTITWSICLPTSHYVFMYNVYMYGCIHVESIQYIRQGGDVCT